MASNCIEDTWLRARQLVNCVQDLETHLVVHFLVLYHVDQVSKQVNHLLLCKFFWQGVRNPEQGHKLNRHVCSILPPLLSRPGQEPVHIPEVVRPLLFFKLIHF